MRDGPYTLTGFMASSRNDWSLRSTASLVSNIYDSRMIGVTYRLVTEQQQLGEFICGAAF